MMPSWCWTTLPPVVMRSSVLTPASSVSSSIRRTQVALVVALSRAAGTMSLVRVWFRKPHSSGGTGQTHSTRRLGSHSSTTAPNAQSRFGPATRLTNCQMGTEKRSGSTSSTGTSQCSTLEHFCGAQKGEVLFRTCVTDMTIHTVLYGIHILCMPYTLDHGVYHEWLADRALHTLKCMVHTITLV
jgi:hypothetical protein